MSTLSFGTDVCTSSFTSAVAVSAAGVVVSSAAGVVAANEGETDTSATILYTEYSAEKLAEAQGNGKLALFFHADWCPSCRALDSDIRESMATLGAGTILKVDYDEETELKREYGITTQHTVVFFDENGELVEKKTGASLEDLQAFFAV